MIIKTLEALPSNHRSYPSGVREGHAPLRIPSGKCLNGIFHIDFIEKSKPALMPKRGLFYYTLTNTKYILLLF